MVIDPGEWVADDRSTGLGCLGEAVHWINTYLATVLVDSTSTSGVEQALSAMVPGDVRVGRSSRGWVEIEFTIEARSVAHASTSAAALARRATGADPIACHVITQNEHAALLATSTPPAARHSRGVYDEDARLPAPRRPA